MSLGNFNEFKPRGKENFSNKFEHDVFYATFGRKLSFMDKVMELFKREIRKRSETSNENKGNEIKESSFVGHQSQPQPPSSLTCTRL